MNKTITFLILLFTIGIYGQNTSSTKVPVVASISNLKLGLSESYILEKYGNPETDTIHNSTREMVYDIVKLDNNHELKTVVFSFFNKKLFKIYFYMDDAIHNGLSAKYGFKDIDGTIGYYGNFKSNILFARSTKDEKNIAVLIDEKTSNLSKSEGF